MLTGKVALVVDDEQHIVHVVALKLRNAGLEVVTASDGEQAYESASKSPPDIVITDLQMPYMNGLELCRKLRENPGTSHIPALMLTARGHALSKEDLAGTNISEVLTKPFSPREILARVEALLGEGTAKAA
jgi:DNA-binding response OmpR family regulator